LALAYANEDANVLKSVSDVNVDSFEYHLELDNSVKADQQGHLRGETWEVEGTHSHTSPEGEQVSRQYVANENGYQVLQANPPLPTPPPIPEAIQRSLDWIAAHPPKE